MLRKLRYEKRYVRRPAGVSSCIGLGTVPAFAHHSAFAFDTERTLIVEGTVTEWFWANPHCLLKFDVATDNGDIVHWVTETQAPANMIDAGWRKNDLKPGDEVYRHGAASQERQSRWANRARRVRRWQDIGCGPGPNRGNGQRVSLIGRTHRLGR